MPLISVVMPVFNVERFVEAAVQSVLAQTFTDFELLIVDDCSPDDSIRLCEAFDDPRIRILRHAQNRGLAGARNTGIRAASGAYIAFLDSDDLWHPGKLAAHVDHLSRRPEVGISFSRSEFIDAEGAPMGVFQMPRMTGIDAAYCLYRNPVGNGSAPVVRREALDAIAYPDSLHGAPETFYFDERFRRSEDIECWVRIALTGTWIIEGLPEPLTAYRLNDGGLSASLLRQYESWEQMIRKLQQEAPRFVARHVQLARAYQLRYLARQAIRLRDGRMALTLTWRALRASPRILLQEPGRTLMTLAAALCLKLTPRALYVRLERLAQGLLGAAHRRKIRQQQVQHAMCVAKCEAA